MRIILKKHNVDWNSVNCGVLSKYETSNTYYSWDQSEMFGWDVYGKPVQHEHENMMCVPMWNRKLPCFFQTSSMASDQWSFSMSDTKTFVHYDIYINMCVCALSYVSFYAMVSQLQVFGLILG